MIYPGFLAFFLEIKWLRKWWSIHRSGLLCAITVGGVLAFQVNWLIVDQLAGSKAGSSPSIGRFWDDRPRAGKLRLTMLPPSTNHGVSFGVTRWHHGAPIGKLWLVYGTKVRAAELLQTAIHQHRFAQRHKPLKSVTDIPLMWRLHKRHGNPGVFIIWHITISNYSANHCCNAHDNHGFMNNG